MFGGSIPPHGWQGTAHCIGLRHLLLRHLLLPHLLLCD